MLRLLPPSEQPAAYQRGVAWTAMLEETRVALHGKAKEYLTLEDVVDSPMLQSVYNRTHIQSVRGLLQTKLVPFCFFVCSVGMRAVS